MGYTIAIINHSMLEPLRNFIFSNFKRPTTLSPTLTRTRTRTTSNDDEDDVYPSPSLVLLPHHLTIKSINRDHLPVVEYATFRSYAEEQEEEEEEEDAEGSDDDCRCAVCLSRIEARDNVRELGNCKHAFHAGCLDSWIDRGGATCPVCRAPLVSDDDEEVSHGKLDPWRSQRMVYLFGEDCFMDEL